MHTSNKAYSLLTLCLLLTGAFLFSSCEKDERVPPELTFKTTAGYTSGDVSAGMNDTLLVGIQADKTEDELNTFNISRAIDGGNSTTVDNYTLTGTQEEHYELDYELITGATAAVENWTFTVTDRDGNITTKTIVVTVQ